MKKNSIQPITILIAILFSYKVPLAPFSAFANAENDHRYALERIGFLRAWDNMDGLFSEYISGSYREYFQKQSRFALLDLSRTDEVLKESSLSYQKIIETPEILERVARSTRVESLLRTKVMKEGARYRVTIDWLLAPKMELIASETLYLREPQSSTGPADAKPSEPGTKRLDLNQISPEIHAALEKLIHRVPFYGHITGRDGEMVTVNIGRTSGVNPGDIFFIGTLDEVRKHPLLKTVVDWNLSPVGRLQVESVDQSIAFCKIVDEQPGREIGKLQKISQIIPRQTQPTVNQSQPASQQLDEMGMPRDSTLGSKDTGQSSTATIEDPTSIIPAKLGYVSAAVWLGSASRTYAVSSDTAPISNTGSGLLMGGKAQGQLWLTSKWFVDALFGYGTASITQTDATSTTAEIGSLTATAFQLAAGYTLLGSPHIQQPRAWARLGYASTRYSLPPSTSNAVGTYSYGGGFLGLGADLPIREKWGATLIFDYGILTSATETGITTAAPDSATALMLFVGGYYRFTPTVRLQFGMDLSANSTDLGSTANTSSKTVGFGPSITAFF